MRLRELPFECSVYIMRTQIRKIDHTRMYAAMNEKENAQCFGVVPRKPSRGRPAAALWLIFINFGKKLSGLL